MKLSGPAAGLIASVPISGTSYYEYPGHTIGTGRTRHVPWLQMRGDWLAAAGFDIQAPVHVRVMPGCLVVTVEQAERESTEG